MKVNRIIEVLKCYENMMKILVVCQYFYPEQFRVNDICSN